MTHRPLPDEPMLPYPEPGGRKFTQGHSGTDTSRDRARREASDGTVKHRQATVLRFADRFRFSGMTVKDLRDLTGWHHGQASSALSALHKEGRLARLTETRDHCKVYVLPENVGERQVEPFGRDKPKEQTYSVREVVMGNWPEDTRFKVVDGG